MDFSLRYGFQVMCRVQFSEAIIQIGIERIQNKNNMNTNLYEVDLLEKYRQSISKRYRGYNRVYQLNVNKLTENSNSVQAFSQKKSSKNPKSSIIEIPKQCHSQTHKNPQNIPKAIVIRSTNAQFSLKEINEQTEVNHKKFIKTKLVKHNKSEYAKKKEQKDEEIPPVSPRDLQSSVEEYFENKFKFKKKLLRDAFNSKFGFTQQADNFIKDDLLRLQPFSPIIRGQKKKPQNKKTKTQNQTILTNDSKRSFLNHTESKREKINHSENVARLKRTNSYVSEKQDGKEDNLDSLSASVEQSQMIKKFSSQFKSKNMLKDKAEMAKVSFPKINCAKQTPKQIENIFVPYLQLQKNREKYRKTPLLIRYPFDARNVESQSFMVMEAESEAILYGCRSNHGFEIASLTKIMTFYVVLKLVEEHNIDIKKEMIEVESECANIGGTSADLFPGEVYSLENLLYGLMLPSGNDAALTLALWGGRLKAPNPEENHQSCIGQFVILMNKEAKNLNLIETRFANPHGLPHRMNRSTALDVAKLCLVCMNNDLFKKVVITRFHKCVAVSKDGRKRFNEWQNTNKLLRRQGFIGIKTGITITAGPCLASAYKFRDKTYISVVLRAKKISRRFKETRKILHWCLSKLYGDSLTSEEVEILKKLKKNNEEIDSDYSEDESVFCYDTNNSKEFRKRCDIISDM